MLSIYDATKFRVRNQPHPSPDSDDDSPATSSTPHLRSGPDNALATVAERVSRYFSHMGSSVFFSVLSAPYTPQVPLAAMAPPLPPMMAQDAQDALNRRTDYVAPTDSDSSDEEGDKPVKDWKASYAAFPAEFADLSLYTPFGVWEWTKGKPLYGWKSMLDLGAGAMCSASISKAYIDGRPLTYISRQWKNAARHTWRGFFSEIALYKSEQYLKALQGAVIPRVIGVYSDPICTTVAMEPPHRSFWIEASPDMPTVLKERCIEAFQRLHARGILHGDVELRHMLIGGDCKVTIIDLQESTAIIPNESVGLQKAEPEEFAMEMRKIKFKLDYDGAKDAEFAKMERTTNQETNNRIRRGHRYLRARGLLVGPVQPDLLPLEEDITVPPPAFNEWTERWVQSIGQKPARVIMPGQSLKQVETAIVKFLETVRCLEEDRDIAAEYTDNADGPPMLQPSLASAARVDARKSAASILQKRKASMNGDVSQPPMKRPRPSASPSSLYGTGPSLPLFGIPGRIPPVVHRNRREPRRIDHTPKDMLPRLIPASASSSASKPPKARDFAVEPYDGPRGYYVPHPPTEGRMSISRVLYVREQNAAECRALGLQYYQRHNLRGAPPQGESIALGALKRKRQLEEDPNWENWERGLKKARYMSGGCSGEAHLASDELLQLSCGDAPRVIKQAERAARPQPAHASSRLSPLRSILRKTPAVTTVSYARADWDEEPNPTLSPKLGPSYMRVSRSEKSPILHSWVDPSLPCKKVDVSDDSGDEGVLQTSRPGAPPVAIPPSEHEGVLQTSRPGSHPAIIPTSADEGVLQTSRPGSPPAAIARLEDEGVLQNSRPGSPPPTIPSSGDISLQTLVAYGAVMAHGRIVQSRTSDTRSDVRPDAPSRAKVASRASPYERRRDAGLHVISRLLDGGSAPAATQRRTRGVRRAVAAPCLQMPPDTMTDEEEEQLVEELLRFDEAHLSDSENDTQMLWWATA